MNRDIKTAILAALVVLMILVICTATGQAADRHSTSYPGTEFKGFVLTDLGTFAIYKAKWGVFEMEFKKRLQGYEGVYTAFSDRKRGEMWYTEGPMDRLLGKFKWYKTPLETELENIGSVRAWNKATEQDKTYEESIKRSNKSMFRFDLKGKPIH